MLVPLVLVELLSSSILLICDSWLAAVAMVEVEDSGCILERELGFWTTSTSNSGNGSVSSVLYCGCRGGGGVVRRDLGRGASGSSGVDSVTDFTIFSKSIGVMCFLPPSEVLKPDICDERPSIAISLSVENLESREEESSGRLRSDE